MQNEENIYICRLCFKSCNDNFQVITDDTEDILRTLHLELDLWITEEPLICRNCGENLKKYFDFKTACLQKENYIRTFETDKDSKEVDLMYMDLRKSEILANNCLDGSYICRLCLHLMKYCDGIVLNGETKEAASLNMVLKRHFPEMLNQLDEESTIICRSCNNTLQELSKFAQTCLHNEETIIKFCDTEDISELSKITMHKIRQFLSETSCEYKINTIDNDGIKEELKQEDFGMVEDQEMTFKQEEIDIKGEPLDCESPQDTPCCSQTDEQVALDVKQIQIKKFSCSHCRYTTDIKQHFDYHLLCHTNSTKMKIYKCDICWYLTRLKRLLVQHSLKHKDASEVTTYKCDSCRFATRDKCRLKQHQIVHENGPEAMRFHCDLCPYRSKYKKSLKRHAFIHTGASEVDLYKCDLCEYQTIDKHFVKRHMVVHDKALTCKNCGKRQERCECRTVTYTEPTNRRKKRHTLSHAPAAPVFRCPECPYFSREARKMRTHALVHKDCSEVPMYRCQLCPFQSKYKSSLKSHQLVHKRGSDVVLFQCEMCPFKTKQRRSMARHFRVNHEPAAPVYSCPVCPYKGKIKDKMKRHILLHRKSEKLERVERSLESCSQK